MAHLQTPWVIERMGLRATDPRREFVVLKPDGVLLGGVDAIAHLMRQIWWARPFWLVAKVPLIRDIMWGVYRWVAARRHCLTGSCPAHFKPSTETAASPAWDWVPLVSLSGAAFAGYAPLPPWAFMWTLAFALFAGCKLATWLRAGRTSGDPGVPRSLGYLFLWVGMDPRPFFETRPNPPVPVRTEWAAAALKCGTGALLLRGAASLVFPHNQMIGTWIGMAGVVMALHFGLFHLMALAWRRAGVDAFPIMRAPLMAASLHEFWGERWNRAFNDLVRPTVFRPLLRRHGMIAATLATFLLSGLVHDLVISVPARAGYGLPTLYFLIQGLGVLLVRSAPGRRVGLNRGFTGWLTTLLITAIPAPLLFHTPFRETVMVPFLQTLNAI